MGKIMYSVRINSEIIQKLKILAVERNTSVSDIVRIRLQNLDLYENEKRR